MRGLLVATLLIAPLLAGCLADGNSNQPIQGDPKALESYDSIPEGAEYVPIDGGMALVWTDQARPFKATFQTPEGATMIRFVADPGDDESVGVAMKSELTGRRRCNQQSVLSLGETLTGPRSCSSVAAIDNPWTPWSVSTSGTTEDPNLHEVRVEFLHTPIDGPAGLVNWNLLTKPNQDLQPTTGQHVPSHDGSELWVEVTTPEGDGPWPTIIAASPYNGQTGRIGSTWSGPEDKGTPAMWTYWAQDWAKRGYAVVNVDVRGFGLSDGCIEVWGINEQLDQKFIVEWTTEQEWSNGHVGFYGQSYVATTPLAAAVHQAEGLDAIIMVAPVVDSYFDWHYGGVPNGESSLSPLVAYQVLTDAPGASTDPETIAEQVQDDDFPTDMATIAEYSAKGLCDPTLAAPANDPRAIHGEFYDERDFGALAADITAATLYTQGFEDANVKSAMIGDIWNDIDAPKLGLFGHWLHQHPPRMDAEVLFLGWMEQHVKGIELGLDAAYPDTIVSVDPSARRAANSWPPQGTVNDDWYLDFDAETFTDEGAGTYTLDVTPASDANTQGTQANGVGEYQIVLTSSPLASPLPVVAPSFTMNLELTGENAMIFAQLDEIKVDGTMRTLTWGMKNLALGDDYDTYGPIVPGTAITDVMPLRPTEHVAATGSTLQLTLRAVQSSDDFLGTALPQPGLATFYGGGTFLSFPVIALDSYEAIPLSELP